MPWSDGFFEIDLSDVPVSDLQSDWAVSKNYTREQMQEWIEHLAAIQEMRDQGATHKDFQQMRTSSDPNERGLGSTYHNFYDHERTGPEANSDHLKVEWNDDRYEIINGRHRIAVAQEAGLTHMPAHVSAREEVQLEKLRAAGEARVDQGRQARMARSAEDHRTDTASSRDPQNASPGEQQSRETLPVWERSSGQESQREEYRERP